MNLDALAQVLLSGVLVGALYGLAALGLSLVFGVLKVLNIAQGELILLGGYLSFWAFSRYGLDPFVSLLLVVPAMFVLGVLLQQSLFARIVHAAEEERIKNSLLIGFGLSLVLHSLAILLWTADDRAITTSYSLHSIAIGSLRIPSVRLAGFGLSLLCALGLDWFLRRTRLGAALRATAEDGRMASLTGIHVGRVYLWTMGIGTALAGVAGVLIALGYSISPAIGLTWTLKALIVVVLAGLGSLGGTLPAGIFLGLAESLGAFFIPNGGQYRELIGIALFLIVLSLRPQGLFGAKLR